MKNSIKYRIIGLAFIISLVAHGATAQKNEQTKTLFGDANLHFRFYVNPELKLSKIETAGAAIPGIGAGIIINEKISIGGVYNFSINDILPKGETDKRLYLDIRYGGLHAEYTIFADRLIHLSIPLNIGIGEVQMDWRDGFGDFETTALFGEANFFIAEPGIIIEMNLWKYLKLGFGGTYRFVNKVSYRNLTEKDLRGLTGVVSLKAGIFK